MRGHEVDQLSQGTNGISQENQLKFNAREFDQRYGVATRPSGGVGGFLRTAGRVGVDVVGKLWALPNTIIGGVVGLGGVPFAGGGKAGRRTESAE
jgi:hypothetical protein